MHERLAELFLFQNLDKSTLIDISKKINMQTASFAAKEIIYTPDNFDRKIGFILSGSCLVERINSENKKVPLNKLSANDSFGIVAVLGQPEKFPTEVKTVTDSEILFISQNDVKMLIDNYPTVAKNIIYYLAQKIVFLNSKIATFASDTVEQKLASYILNEKNKTDNNFITFNCKRSAEAINIGRASLYRALTSLTEANLIKLENKKIYILDRKGLERILK